MTRTGAHAERVAALADNSTHLPPLPHLPVECSCAMLPGPFGDWTRRKMDALAAEYDKAVLQLVREWNAHHNPTFAVVWCVVLALLMLCRVADSCRG